MEKKNFSCSCFIDQSIWFVNSLFYSWMFDTFVYTNGSLSDNLFIYDKKFTFNVNEGNVQYVSEIIVCCLECFEFLLVYSSGKKEIIDAFNEIDCLFVVEEPFCYNSEIYIGNDQFAFDGNERERSCNSTEEKLEKYFREHPTTKSCFTSIEKYYYQHFCSSYKKIFKKLFLKNLSCFEK